MDTPDVDSAPHYLKLLQEYGKLSITLSISFLSLSVLFSKNLLSGAPDFFQGLLLTILWVFLLISLLASLWMVGNLVAVSSNYQRARRLAFPDLLRRIANGELVTLNDASTKTLQITDDKQRAGIDQALSQSSVRLQSAMNCARITLVMYGSSAFVLAVLGFYGTFLRGGQATSDDAVRKSMAYVKEHYGVVEKDASLSTLALDSDNDRYTVLVTDISVKKDYKIDIDRRTGDVISSTDRP